MSHIALIIDSYGTEKIGVIRTIQELIPESVAAVNHSVESGQPVFVQNLFDRRTPEFATNLLQFFEWLDAHLVPDRAFELRDGERFEQSQCAIYYRIDQVRLRNLISGRRAIREELDSIDLPDGGIDD